MGDGLIRSMTRWLGPALAFPVLLAGCEEQLTVPGRCPELCPGGQPVVRDTIVLAIPGSDTTFAGYSGLGEITSLLVSNGLAAGEARAWIRFPQRADSVRVSEINRAYTMDSVIIAVNLVARDTLVDGLKFYLHRLPYSVDTLATFAEIDAALTPATLLDSIEVADSVRSGTVRVKITDSAAMANLIPPDDSGRLALGVRLVAAEPTGARLGTIGGASGAASFTTYVKAVGVTDTALQRQTIALTADSNGYVRDNGNTPFDPDLLYLGRVPTTRTLLRFPVPDFLLDSSVVLVRATLELTPAEPLIGLRGDAATIEARGVARDIGAKSTPNFLFGGSARLPELTPDRVGVDVREVVQLWRTEDGLPPTLLVALTPDGGSFHQPVFFSTRSPTGTPRLRLTYLRPSSVEQP